MKSPSATPEVRMLHLVGRPNKRTPEVVERLLSKLRTGHSMVRASRWAGIHPKTAQRWLKVDRSFLEAVVEAQLEGAPSADLVRWVNHPFRGKRPPRSKKGRNRPYPKPKFFIPENWRYTSYRGGGRVPGPH
jgi:hypothetical protein